MVKVKGSFFYITSFYRSLFAIIGGVLLILISISGFKKNIDDYSNVSGVIEKAHLYWDKSPYNIRLRNSNGQWYSVYPEEYYPILKKKAIPGKQAEIWFNPKNNRIKKLIVEGEELKPFKKSIGVNIVFIIVGGLFVLYNLIYIVRNPSHAKGKSKDN